MMASYGDDLKSEMLFTDLKTQTVQMTISQLLKNDLYFLGLMFF